MAETQFFATFEAAYDVIATDSRFKKTETSIIPSNTSIIFLDSTFDDGDPVDVMVDFGGLGNDVPHGTLCQDGRYRAGKMYISLNQSIESAEFRATVTTTAEDSFYCGNGEEMVQLIGKMIISLAGPSAIKISVSNATLIDGENESQWKSERIITQIEDGGDGIWGDTYSVSGSASGVNREGEAFNVTIDKPLIKRMEKGCAKTFVEGVLTVSSAENSQKISIDYDPYKNQACDLFAEANLNGRKTIFKIK